MHRRRFENCSAYSTVINEVDFKKLRVYAAADFLYVSFLYTMCVSQIKKEEESKHLPICLKILQAEGCSHTLFSKNRTDRPVRRVHCLPRSSMRMASGGGWAVHLKEAWLPDSACIYFKVNTALFFQFFNWKINKTTDPWNLNQREKRESEKKIALQLKTILNLNLKNCSLFLQLRRRWAREKCERWYVTVGHSYQLEEARW